MPEDLKKEIFEYSRLDKLDLDKLTKFKTAKAIEAAATNEGGTAGAGMGMGMGFVLAQQMGGTMMGSPQATPQMGGQQPFQNQVTPVPPPMPVSVQYFYAVNGTQQGPVSFDQLKGLFANRTVNKESLIWKQGMSGWTALQEVEELKSFLGGNTPPPLPS